MRTIYLLLKLRFITPYSLLLLYRAKRKHGKNLSFLMKFAADHYGDRIAIADDHARLNFRQLYETVLALSYVIRQRVQCSDCMTAVLVFNNSVNHILTLYAIQNLGIKLILVNDKMLSSDILTIINKQPGPCAVFGSASGIEKVIDINELIAAVGKEKGRQYYSKNNARVVFPTSGTTGEVKLIEKRSGEFYWLQSFADLIRRTAIDKRNAVYIAVPVSHGFGYTALLFALVLGKKAVLTSAKSEKSIVGLITREKVDILVGVPTALYRIAVGLESTIHTVQSIVSGGSALNETIFNKLVCVTRNIFSIYGSTETSTSFIAEYSQLTQDVYALGTPLSGVEYRVQVLPTGGTELVIKSPLANTGSRFDWIATGDLVEEKANGAIIWCSRKDDMIIKMGMNIYPVEIERQLMQLGCFEEAYVTRERDTVKGEIIVAFVQTKLDSYFDEKTVNQKLRLVLSGIKIPDKMQVVDCFNYTSTGKKIRPTIFPILK